MGVDLLTRLSQSPQQPPLSHKVDHPLSPPHQQPGGLADKVVTVAPAATAFAQGGPSAVTTAPAAAGGLADKVVTTAPATAFAQGGPSAVTTAPAAAGGLADKVVTVAPAATAF